MKHLIVIADPAKGKNTALKRALEIQQRTGARISLLGFCYASLNDSTDFASTGLSSKQLRSAVLQQRRTQLDAAVAKFNKPRAKISVYTLWSKDIVKATIEFCKKHPAELLIKSGKRSETWLYTSVDWQLFRQSPIPVMITAGKSWKKKSRILVAVDIETKTKSKQQLNDRIVAQAKLLADALEDNIHLACAITLPQPLADLDLLDPRKYYAEKCQKLQPAIERFCARHGLNPQQVHLKQGTAEKIIPSIANELKADLVIAGTVGRKGVRGKLIGNTAERILSHLYTDILAVRP